MAGAAQQPVVYALVADASDGAPLASYAAVSGNFEPIARDVIASASAGGGAGAGAAAGADAAGRFSIVCDGHTFNFLPAPAGCAVVCTVVRDEAARPFAFGAAQRIADAWGAAAGAAGGAPPDGRAFK
jgi:hypothetical protein